MDDLTSQLQALGIAQVPSLPEITTYPTLNQVDIYRSHIAEKLAPIAGVPANIVYNALQWTQTLDKGDLMLPVPALRIKGKKPDVLAQEICDQV